MKTFFESRGLACNIKYGASTTNFHHSRVVITSNELPPMLPGSELEDTLQTRVCFAPLTIPYKDLKLKFSFSTIEFACILVEIDSIIRDADHAEEISKFVHVLMNERVVSQTKRPFTGPVQSRQSARNPDSAEAE